MSQQNDIEQIEISIEEAQKLVDRAEAARRLADHPDFKALILTGYFTDEAARLAQLVSHPSAKAHKEEVMNDLLGIGGLRRFLQTVIMMGDHAAREIAEAREELDEIRAEEARQ